MCICACWFSISRSIIGCWLQSSSSSSYSWCGMLSCSYWLYCCVCSCRFGMWRLIILNLIIMRDFFKNYPVVYLILFCLLTLYAGIEVANLIKNGLPEENYLFYFKLFGIIINFSLAILFLVYFVRIKNSKSDQLD